MKKYLFNSFVVGLAITFVSFSQLDATSKVAQICFRYLPCKETEASLETASSWQLTNCGGTVCIGTQIVCVVRVQDTDIAVFPGPTVEEKFVNFLKSKPSAIVFVNDPANLVSRKQGCKLSVH